MSDGKGIRPNEQAIEVTPASDASLAFIGVIHTPWNDRKECPRQGQPDGPQCQIVLNPEWAPALQGLAAGQRVEIYYWLDKSRRDLVLQCPKHKKTPVGTFALRSPARPNPIGVSLVQLDSIEGNVLTVRGLDCLNGTHLLDIKPERCTFSHQVGTSDSAH